MKLIWRILQRYYEVRAKRASKAAVDFKSRAEKFFNKIKGASE